MHAISIGMSSLAIAISLVSISLAAVTGVRLRGVEKWMRRLKHLQRTPSGQDVWPPS